MRLPSRRVPFAFDERIVGVTLFLAMALRVVAALRYRIDSDEPQHLHVVWGWTRGLLQYRDVADNHMPLFHVLTAPILQLFGEHAESLLAVRFAMLPLFAAALVLTYRVASTCYSHRDALWATAFAALVPTFFLTSSEFRPDTLWAVCWLAAIYVLVVRPPTTSRALLAGFLIGCAFAVSMKTSLLVISLIAGTFAAAAASRSRRQVAAIMLRSLPPLVLGAFVVPAAIALFFATNGALWDFYYGTLGHNLIWRWRINRLIAYPFVLALIVMFIREFRRSSDDDGRVTRRVFIFATAQFYAATMFCLWPLVEREHWLPYVPLAAISFVPVLSRNVQRIAFVAAQLALVIGFGALWRDNTVESLRIIDQTLRLTSPAEAVVDVKGETVFRHRAIHYVFEPITKQRIHEGTLPFSFAEDVIAHQALVVVGDNGSYPRRVRAFLDENFVRAGAIRVAGCVLPSNGGTFTIRIPARYAIAGGDTRDLAIDGVPYRGPEYLAAGTHTFVPRRRATHLVMIWARAVERGFSPCT